jgi:site-specific DNA recombinase
MVQDLLSERGEDYSKHASATSPFLLAGLVVCARCGKRFVGTSAVGNRYRYRYYTCFPRQRYGTKYCGAERLPAEELDAAVLDALVCTYDRTDLFDKAVAAARRRARAERSNRDQELAVIDAGITKAEDAIEHYLSAFEDGTPPPGAPPRGRPLPLGVRGRDALRGPVRQAPRRARHEGARPPRAA